MDPRLPVTRWVLRRTDLPSLDGTPRHLYRVYPLGQTRGLPVAVLAPDRGGVTVTTASGDRLRFGSVREARGELWLYVTV